MSMSLNKAIFVPAGTVIFQEGDEPDVAYLVVAGSLKVTTLRDGQEIVVTTVKPMQMFGELALIESAPRSATVTAVEDSELMKISRRKLMDKINGLDPFTRYWVLYLRDRVKDLSKRLTDPLPK